MNGGESHMRSEHVDEVLLVKYLLGSVTEDEQVQVENRAFADASQREALEAAEADLIDAYVHRHLSQGDRRAFEHRFLTSQGRRKKVEFAKALAQLASEPHAVSQSATWQALLSVMRLSSRMLQVAAALAIAIFVIGGSWVVLQNIAMRSHLASLESQRRDLEIREEGLRHQLAVQSQRQQSPAPALAPPVVASLVFAPGLTRAGTRVERLRLSPFAQIARVEIQLEPRDDYLRFRAELHTRGGKGILTQDDLSRRQTNTGFSITFDIPASALADGQYELALKATPDKQSVQEIGYYYFSVQRQ
jgi:hypothetical protein